MEFREAVSVCLRKKYATFRGRATRSEYWWFWLFCMLVLLAASAVDAVFFGAPEGLCSGLLALALLLPSLAVQCRRLHDAGFRGWWLLLALTGIGALVLIVFYCLPSRAAGDRFNEPDEMPSWSARPAAFGDSKDPVDPMERWKQNQAKR